MLKYFISTHENKSLESDADTKMQLYGENECLDIVTSREKRKYLP